MFGVGFLFAPFSVIFIIAAVAIDADAEVVASGLIGLLGCIGLIWISADVLRSVYAEERLLQKHFPVHFGDDSKPDKEKN